MTGPWKHPENLLWFVAGGVEPFERQRIVRHIESCEECRDEAAALASMMKSIVAQTHLDHVSAEDLVLFEEAALRRDSDKSARIRRHVEECPACREELETIALARRREVAVRPAPPLVPVGRDIPAAIHVRPRRRWMLGAAAAGIVTAIALGMTGVPPRAPEPAGPVAMKLVVLGAPQRGSEAAAIMNGAGPWAVRVLLPYGTGRQSYRVTIRRQDQGAVAGFDTTASTDAEDCLGVILPGLPSTGRYEMVLQPLTGDDMQERVYPFEYMDTPPSTRAG